MAKKRRGIERNGRSSPEQFMVLPYGFVHSDAFRSLSGSAVKIFIEIHSKFNGHNNGKLSLSYADAENRLSIGCSTIHRSFKELEKKGLLKKIKQGHWYGRKATEWAITTKPLDGYIASNDWKHWRKPKHEKDKNRFPDGVILFTDNSLSEATDA